MPKKVNGIDLPKLIKLQLLQPGGEGHRGFCFIDFMSVGDARRAMDALAHSTHLYGRRLVLEWAKIEESMDELRSKTKRKAHANKYSKKSKTKMRSFVVE
jgi:multiple RNA-binding domain-containing protein 1